MVRFPHKIVLPILGLVGCSQAMMDGLTPKAHTSESNVQESNHHQGSERIDTPEEAQPEKELQVDQPTEVGGAFLTAQLHCAYDKSSDSLTTRPFGCRFEEDHKKVDIPASANVVLRTFKVSGELLLSPAAAPSGSDWHYRGIIPSADAIDAYAEAEITYEGKQYNRRAPILDHLTFPPFSSSNESSFPRFRC